jgi:DNA-binding transcriptional MerR regulator/methylmalonyl-CoA mutase cobalamin-binding subunit
MSQSELAQTPRHPIRIVAERTGLTVDVLRAWQKRYGAVRPGRSESGQRLYSDADIERLRLIAEAVRAGRSVGLVAGLSSEEIIALIREDQTSTRPRADEVQRVVTHCLTLTGALDDAQLEIQLRRALLAFGVDTFLDGIAAPLLTRIGDAWESGELTPAHEHMASAVIRRVLDWVIASAETGDDAPLMMLTTPSGDLHELGAMLAATIAALGGWQVRYLGPNLPATDLARAAQQADARAVSVSVVHAEDTDLNKYFNDLVKELDGTTLFAGGAAAQRVEVNGVRVFTNLQEFRSELAVVRAAVSG